MLKELNGISEVNWIKIDVEGAELEVLKGAQSIFSESKDLSILMEVHGKDKFSEIIDLLDVYNFKVEYEKNYEWGDNILYYAKMQQHRLIIDRINGLYYYQDLFT